jgi:hypothetical protein
MNKITVLLAAVFVFGCGGNDSISPGRGGNWPDVQSSDNSFTYSFNASNQSGNDTYTLYFSTNSVTYSLVVNNYQSGKATVVVTGDNEIVWSERDFTEANETATIHGSSAPTYCTVTCQNFTGQIIFSCTGNVTVPFDW